MRDGVNGAGRGVLALADGTMVGVREVRAGDAPALKRLVGRLSERSVRLRYFGPMKELSDAQARRFAEVDGVDRYALGRLGRRGVRGAGGGPAAGSGFGPEPYPLPHRSRSRERHRPPQRVRPAREQGDARAVARPRSARARTVGGRRETRGDGPLARLQASGLASRMYPACRRKLLRRGGSPGPVGRRIVRCEASSFFGAFWWLLVRRWLQMQPPPNSRRTYAPGSPPEFASSGPDRPVRRANGNATLSGSARCGRGGSCSHRSSPLGAVKAGGCGPLAEGRAGCGGPLVLGVLLVDEAPVWTGEVDFGTVYAFFSGDFSISWSPNE